MNGQWLIQIKVLRYIQVQISRSYCVDDKTGDTCSTASFENKGIESVCQSELPYVILGPGYKD